MKTKHLKDIVRQPYAWPGGYPKFLIMASGEGVCKKCAKDNAKLIIKATRQGFDAGWEAVAVDVNWEDENLFCDHCGDQIESAYGEPC